jgi:fucose 4-O-acetylase-like acetyltransferase
LISYLVKGYTGYSFLGFGYASVRIILGLSSAPLGGVLWFLRSLLTVSILFSLLRLLIKNIKYKNIIAGTLILVITTIGYFTQLPYNISSSFVALLFYYSGYLFSQNISYLKLNYWGAFLSFGIVLFATLINQVDLAFNEYRYFFLFVLSSFAGTYLVLFVSLKIQHHGLLEKIGQRSLVIMGFHFFAFVLVNYLIQTIYSLPVEKIMDFPTIQEYRYWWIIYSIIGVSVPFGVIDSTINVITQRMKTIIPEKYSIIALFNKLNLF